MFNSLASQKGKAGLRIHRVKRYSVFEEKKNRKQTPKAPKKTFSVALELGKFPSHLLIKETLAISGVFGNL